MEKVWTYEREKLKREVMGRDIFGRASTCQDLGKSGQWHKKNSKGAIFDAWCARTSKPHIHGQNARINKSDDLPALLHVHVSPTCPCSEHRPCSALVRSPRLAHRGLLAAIKPAAVIGTIFVAWGS
jgi:hypothetical protein